MHDLRRTAVWDFLEAGVDESTIMLLCDWKTRSVFDRYNIINQDRLAAAVATRFNGTDCGTVRGFSSSPRSCKFKPCIARRRSQVVRQRSAKPLFVGSIPTGASR